MLPAANRLKKCGCGTGSWTELLPRDIVRGQRELNTWVWFHKVKQSLKAMGTRGGQEVAGLYRLFPS